MLDHILEREWQELAQGFAMQQFPVGSIVTYDLRRKGYSFGMVENITDDGRILVLKGSLLELSVKRSGTYLVHRYDAAKFIPDGHRRMTFTPHLYHDWLGTEEPKIIWQASLRTANGASLLLPQHYANDGVFTDAVSDSNRSYHHFGRLR
jgi:hypothetical protein